MSRLWSSHADHHTHFFNFWLGIKLLNHFGKKIDFCYSGSNFRFLISWQVFAITEKLERNRQKDGLVNKFGFNSQKIKFLARVSYRNI